MSKGLCHALLCSLPGTGGDAGLHPAPLLNPAPAGEAAACLCCAGHAARLQVHTRRLECCRVWNGKLPFPLRGGVNTASGVARDLSCSSGQQMWGPCCPCDTLAISMQCPCSALAAPVVYQRWWLPGPGYNCRGKTTSLTHGVSVVNLAMKFGVMNYI